MLNPKRKTVAWRNSFVCFLGRSLTVIVATAPSVHVLLLQRWRGYNDVPMPQNNGQPESTVGRTNRTRERRISQAVWIVRLSCEFHQWDWWLSLKVIKLHIARTPAQNETLPLVIRDKRKRATLKLEIFAYKIPPPPQVHYSRIKSSAWVLLSQQLKTPAGGKGRF